jgi:four helix bundle protein
MTPSAPYSIRSYRQLIVWQKAVRLAVEVYAITDDLPSEERFGLSQQLRRAATSVAANIAEGHARQLRRDFAQFLSIARGSLGEVDAQLEIATQAGLLTAGRTKMADGLSDEISRMLTTLIQKVSRPSTLDPRP